MVDQLLQRFKGTTPPMVLGIDPALGVTGLSFHDGKGFYLFSIETGSLRSAERLTYIRRALRKFIEGCDPKPILAAIENYSYGSSGDLAHLGEAGGVIRQLLFEMGIPFLEPSPMTVKKCGTGRGSATKERVIAVTNSRYSLDLSIKESDLADAAVISRFAYVFCTRKSPFRSELDAVYSYEKDNKNKKKYKTTKATI